MSSINAMEEKILFLEKAGYDTTVTEIRYKAMLEGSTAPTIESGHSENYHHLQTRLQLWRSQTNVRFKIKVKPIIESLDLILAKRLSVARFGDGEVDLMCGLSIPYQPYRPSLAMQLHEVLAEEDRKHFLVCLPDVFEHTERYKVEANHFWDGHLERYAKFYNKYCQSDWYGSTFISRPYIDWVNGGQAAEAFDKLKRLWQNQDLLIVEGVASRSGIGNDLFDSAKSIERIICPAQNAYDRYDDIKAAIRQHGQNKMVLLMLGPTAKVLAYELSKEAFWMIDLGHIDSEYEWFKMNAPYKIKLSHKHTAEFNFSDDETEFIDNETYQNQIICSIVDK